MGLVSGRASPDPHFPVSHHGLLSTEALGEILSAIQEHFIFAFAHTALDADIVILKPTRRLYYDWVHGFFDIHAIGNHPANSPFVQAALQGLSLATEKVGAKKSRGIPRDFF